MGNPEFNTQRIVDYWISGSDKDFETMNHLFESRDFHWSLFLGHLVLEKLIKALVVKTTGKHAPLTHDLRRLALLSGVEFPEADKSLLDTITTFNINARYDDYKQAFYLSCTPEYTSVWIENITLLRAWIKTKL